MRLIRRSYTYLDKTSFHCLFNGLVRLHLEYCLSIWYSLLKKEKELIENVLRRASKVIPGILNFSYADRFRAINIPSIKYRRIQVYKILHSEDESPRALLIVDSTSIARGQKFKLKKPFNLFI